MPKKRDPVRVLCRAIQDMEQEGFARYRDAAVLGLREIKRLRKVNAKLVAGCQAARTGDPS